MLIKKKYTSKDKQPPGTIRLHNKNIEDIKISIINYNIGIFTEKIIDISEIDEISINNKNKTWIHCPTTLNSIALEKFGKKFNIHSLILENIQNIEHRPSLNDTEEFNFVIQKGLKIENNILIKNHIAYIVYENLIITFADNHPFTVIQDRLKNNLGVVRERTSDYLLFSLMDVINDDYFEVLDSLEHQVTLFESELFSDYKKLDINKLLMLKNKIGNITKTINPLHNIINGIITSNRPCIDSNNLIYFKDLQNNILQIIEQLSNLSVNIDNVLNLSINISGYNMNKIMKVLTIFSAIFMPLTFIAGIYGMNFKFIPELDFQYSYPIVLSLMLIIALNMILYFKRNKWF